jgi:hypothetical protein
MTRKDFPAFTKVVLGFAEVRGKKLSEEALEIYWRAMAHWTLADFEEAAAVLLRTSRFMPTPKEFEDLRKRATETAPEAWVEILRRARRGDFDLAGLSSAARLAVTALGGIRAVAMSETAHTHFLEKRFCEHYGELQDAYTARNGSQDGISYLERQRLTHTEN